MRIAMAHIIATAATLPSIDEPFSALPPSRVTGTSQTACSTVPPPGTARTTGLSRDFWRIGLGVPPRGRDDGDRPAGARDGPAYAEQFWAFTLGSELRLRQCSGPDLRPLLVRRFRVVRPQRHGEGALLDDIPARLLPGISAASQPYFEEREVDAIQNLIQSVEQSVKRIAATP